MILNSARISLLSYEINFISLCQVVFVKQPPKINELVMKSLLCQKWSEGSRVASLRFQNGERMSKMYTFVSSSMECFKNSSKQVRFSLIFVYFQHLGSGGKVVGHYVLKFRYISEVRIFQSAHLFLLSYEINLISIHQLGFMRQPKNSPYP